MKHRLILMLGKGQPVLRGNRELTYRMANYIYPGKPERVVKTPFVGEAIVSLYKEESFEDIHIFGTQDSMWSTLYGHCKRKELVEDDYLFSEFLDEQISQKIPLTDESLKRISEVLSAYLRVPTHCKLIPVGKSEAEMWDIFKAIISVPQAGDQVSIDITHGVRFQPFILILAMAYFRAVGDRIKWAKVFYGAYELSQDYFEEKSPVFDLSSIFTMFDWLAAANAFSDYGDLAPITRLLKDLLPGPEGRALIEKGQNFIKTVQLYDTDHIGQEAKAFIQQLDKLLAQNNPADIPFRLIEPKIRSFPAKLAAAKRPYQIMLRLAQQHLQVQGQFGLASLALWEAIIGRFADLFEVDKGRIQNYLALSKIVKGYIDWPRAILNSRLANFNIKVRNLNGIRNQIAHTDAREIQALSSLSAELWELYAYFNASLEDPELELLPALIVFEPVELNP